MSDGPDIQYFAGSGTWIKPAGAIRADVMLQAAGAGAGIALGGVSVDGQDGQLICASYPADTLPAIVEVTIGKGGRGSGGADDGEDGYALILTHLSR